VGLFTGLSAMIYPISVAITNDRMESTRIVAASATLLLSYGVGSVIGPVAMAELINLMGPKGLFVGNAGFLLVLAVITSLRITYTDDVAVEDQEHYVPAMPETSAVLTEMDPRNTAFQQSPEIEDMAEESIRQSG
jgi:MFS family permease